MPAVEEDQIESAPMVTLPRQVEPVKSVVQIHFPVRNMTLAYFNDQFDLRRGDLVYVDGKLEGLRGRVVDVSYNFKIKLSKYQRVVALVDTDVHGTFHLMGTHFVTFHRDVLPQEKIRAWFIAPNAEDDEYVSGTNDETFALDNLKEMHIGHEIAERGHLYYIENRVRYISLNGNKGYALVEGSEAYEVEFEYQDGMIRNLVCGCFCSYHCKHEFAVMLQLSETLEMIKRNYAAEYEKSNYFAAVCKGTLFSFALDRKETGSITI